MQHPTPRPPARTARRMPGPSIVDRRRRRNSSASCRSLLPILHPLKSCLPISRRNRLSFVADAMQCDDPSARHEEVKNSRVQFPDVPQFEQAVADRLGKWRTVVRPVPQFGEARDDNGKIVRIALPERLEKFFNGALSCFRQIKLYREFHCPSTSNLAWTQLSGSSVGRYRQCELKST